MKIDFVLTAGNIHPHYTRLFPLVYKVWKERFNLDCYLILIADNIPDYLIDLKDFIILWKHNKNLKDSYLSQVIRILYPALYPDKNILITDLDIFPIKKSYFIEPIENMDEDKFIAYTDRSLKQNMINVCYNVAKGITWANIFNIKTEQDIINRLDEWYNEEYTGKKNCPGWYTDQEKLYEYVLKYNEDKVIFLKDKEIGYNRLNNRQVNKVYIVNNFEEICSNINKYNDIHAIKPYRKIKWYLNKLVESIINSQ